MNYISFNEYLNKYLKFKQLHEHEKLNPTNFIYKRCKLNESLLLNKTPLQKNFINLYETYIHTYIDINSYYNLYDKYIDSINEGLIYTYPNDIFIKSFIKETGISDMFYQFIINNTNTKIIQIILYLDEYDLFYNKIKQYIYKCGYFILICQKDIESNQVSLLIEPKYIVEITSKDDKFDQIYDGNNDNVKNKCNGILYHITLASKYNKILNTGLIPKSGNKRSNHPERIYLFPKNKLKILNKSIFEIYAKRLYYKVGTTEYIDSVKPYIFDNKLEIAVLKIDLYKYPQLKYRFFEDPNWSDAVFTYEPVHPICVDLYDTFYI